LTETTTQKRAKHLTELTDKTFVLLEETNNFCLSWRNKRSPACHL